MSSVRLLGNVLCLGQLQATGVFDSSDRCCALDWQTEASSCHFLLGATMGAGGRQSLVAWQPHELGALSTRDSDVGWLTFGKIGQQSQVARGAGGKVTKAISYVRGARMLMHYLVADGRDTSQGFHD